MNRTVKPNAHVAFQRLTPEIVLGLVEKGLDIRCTNLCRPLASYINRVYELEGEDGEGLVVKFYRPGRWAYAALQDEHEFLLELVGREIPVIAPLVLQGNSSLGEHEGMYFAVFPKCGGRSSDEYTDEQWLEIGRLLGRTHAVGAGRVPEGRITMTPDKSTRQQVDYLLAGDFMDADLASQFGELATTLIAEINPLFKNTEMIRIHGDCHFSNLIYRPGESFYLIDFDDMALGPPVQDFWMLLPGYREETFAEIDLFLEGYETFRDFDRRSLRLIEPLRAMRYIHYMAWCAYQVAEEGLSRVAPDFGSHDYWQREIRDLAEQLQRIRTTPEPQGNWL
ncbi:MAG: serine/threonine protein kinase [Proteobacteria bacterium]|nr:serine/threonine protein kinase [Pseudomonadota bacterium]